MITTVAVVAEEELIVVVRGATDAAVLALDTLPPVPFHGNHHVGSELQTGRVTRAATIRTRDQFLAHSRFLILTRVPEAKVAVRRGSR